jgi:ribulose-5-phosphate 4-epimerase/fuculose-1-phosphate aldolase
MSKEDSPAAGADLDLRTELASCCRRLLALGLVTGTSGNVSALTRGGELCLVTPSGVDYESMLPGDLVPVRLNGMIVDGSLLPSVDTEVHLRIYRARSDVGAVLHTHSPYATAFSAVRRRIPPLITEAAGFLGGAVEVMDYLPPASPSLAEGIVGGLGPARSVLLANHGVVAVGEDLKSAFHAAVSVEESARVAFLAICLGDWVEVEGSEVDRMYDFIHHRYGQRPGNPKMPEVNGSEGVG